MPFSQKFFFSAFTSFINPSFFLCPSFLLRNSFHFLCPSTSLWDDMIWVIRIRDGSVKKRFSFQQKSSLVCVISSIISQNEMIMMTSLHIIIKKHEAEWKKWWKIISLYELFAPSWEHQQNHFISFFSGCLNFVFSAAIERQLFVLLCNKHCWMVIEKKWNMWGIENT